MLICFIAGLEHSGTTLLDFIVGGGRGAVALGEVSSFINSEGRSSFLSRYGHFETAHLCSCGKRHENCNFWAPVVRYIASNPSSDLVMRYISVLDSVEKNLGSDVLVSDSSKSKLALSTVLEAAKQRPGTKVKVLFAIKDVRSFVASIAQRRNLNLRGQFSCFRWWEGSNKNFLSFLQTMGIPYRVVLYEALCLRTRPTVESVYEFLGLKAENYSGALTTKLAHKRSHICMGNADMVFRNSDEIRYDCRWFNRLSINLLYGAVPRVRRMNEGLLAEYLEI